MNLFIFLHMASPAPRIPGLSVSVRPSDAPGSTDLIAEFHFAGSHVSYTFGKDTKEIATILRSMADLVEEAPILPPFSENRGSTAWSSEWTAAIKAMANIPTYPPNSS